GPGDAAGRGAPRGAGDPAADRGRARLPVRRRAPLHRSGNRPGAAGRRARPARRLPRPVRPGAARAAGAVCRGRDPPCRARPRRAAGPAAAGAVRGRPRERRGMNPVLLLPAGLAALAALALPLLVHLSRRQQQRPTVFAALRWLQARPRPRRRLRFDERWLLAVRLLLVALVALLLAQPALRDVADLRARLLVVPGVETAAIAAARDGRELDARWLAPGFPSLDAEPPAGRFATASLLREFDATLPPGAPLTVLVPERLAGMDAARLRLVREVEWRIAAGEGSSDPADAAADVEAPTIAIRHEAAHRDGARYLRAAALAWRDGDEAAPDVE